MRSWEEDQKQCEKAVPWFVGLCSEGEACWCRTISEKPDSDPNADSLEFCIVPSGAISRENAEWIVMAREALPFWLAKHKEMETTIANLNRQLELAATTVSGVNEGANHEYWLLQWRRGAEILNAGK